MNPKADELLGRIKDIEADGLFAYVQGIVACTEQYWRPIKRTRCVL